MDEQQRKMLERLLSDPPEPTPVRYAIYTRQSVEKLSDFSSCGRVRVRS